MPIIQINRVTFAYDGEEPIFENVNLQISTDWRLGLVGRNGRGKTTFLKLLQNQYSYMGSICAPVRFAYFPYTVPDTALSAEKVVLAVNPAVPMWQAQCELRELCVDEATGARPFASLSEGEKTKVLLAAMFLSDADFWLIDEPTNHLDAAARQQVAAYLRQKYGFIVASHDRCFLDACTDHTLAINRTDIELQSGSYTQWRQNFEARQQSEQAQNERLKKDIARLQQSAREAAGWAQKTEASKNGKQPGGLKADKGYVGHKAAKMMKHAKTIQQRREKAAEEKTALLKDTETTEKIKMQPLRYHAEVLAVAEKLTVYRGQSKVIGPLSFTVNRGARIALNGRNGAGKSSLLRLLIGENVTYCGMLAVGAGVKISYVPQDASFLRGSLRDFAWQNELDESLFKSVLRKLGFPRSSLSGDTALLSAGQKKLVLLAKSLCTPAHLYVWDEPLNYVDLYAAQQMEQVITEYSPTMIFAEHDAHFRSAAATEEILL